MKVISLIYLAIRLAAPVEPLTPAPDYENVSKAIVDSGIQHPEIVFAQAILETGHFECKSCSMQYNNLFGFKTSAYLKFKNWIASVSYYKWWQRKLYKGGDYYKFLSKVGYASAKNYIRELKKIVGQIKSGQIKFNSVHLQK